MQRGIVRGAVRNFGCHNVGGPGATSCGQAAPRSVSAFPVSASARAPHTLLRRPHPNPAGNLPNAHPTVPSALSARQFGGPLKRTICQTIWQTPWEGGGRRQECTKCQTIRGQAHAAQDARQCGVAPRNGPQRTICQTICPPPDRPQRTIRQTISPPTGSTPPSPLAPLPRFEDWIEPRPGRPRFAP